MGAPLGILGILLAGLTGMLCGLFVRRAADRLSGGKPIGGRTLAIEAVVAALFIAIFLDRGASPSGLLLALLVLGLATLSVVDLKISIIPDNIQLVLAPLGVVYRTVDGSSVVDDILISLIGGAFAGGVAFAVHYGFKRLRGRDGLGLGDVKFFAVAGLWLGPFGLPAFMIVSGVTGVVFALLWRRLGGGREFPFGPSLALGLFICLLFPALTRIFG